MTTTDELLHLSPIAASSPARWRHELAIATLAPTRAIVQLKPHQQYFTWWTSSTKTPTASCLTNAHWLSQLARLYSAAAEEAS